MADEQGTTVFDLEARIEQLERIIIALTSGQNFGVCLDEKGRPLFMRGQGEPTPTGMWTAAYGRRSG